MANEYLQQQGTSTSSPSSQWAIIAAADLASIAAHTLLANPTGSSAAPSAITLGAGLSFSGTTLVASGGSGTVTSIVAGTGLSGGTITTTGTIAIAALGVDTAQLAAAGVTYAKIQNVAAHALLGNPTGSPASPSEITLGAGLSFSGTTLVGSGGTGTVTSVAMTVPSIMAISGSPITTSGTLAITLQTETANLFFAGPTTGSAAVPTFRALVQADITNGIITTASIATNTILFANIQQIATHTLLGNSTAGTANAQEITLGAGLSFSGTTLVGQTGTVTSVVAGTGLTGGTITTTGTIALSATGLTITQHAGAIGTGSIVSTTCTFDLSTHDWYTLTLAHTATTTLALSNATTGQQFTLILVQDGTGSCLVTWFSGIQWPGGTVPTLTATAGKADIFTFKCFGTNTYYGFTPGLSL